MNQLLDGKMKVQYKFEGLQDQIKKCEKDKNEIMENLCTNNILCEKLQRENKSLQEKLFKKEQELIIMEERKKDLDKNIETMVSKEKQLLGELEKMREDKLPCEASGFIFQIEMHSLLGKVKYLLEMRKNANGDKVLFFEDQTLENFQIKYQDIRKIEQHKRGDRVMLILRYFSHFTRTIHFCLENPHQFFQVFDSFFKSN